MKNAAIHVREDSFRRVARGVEVVTPMSARAIVKRHAALRRFARSPQIADRQQLLDEPAIWLVEGAVRGIDPASIPGFLTAQGLGWGGPGGGGLAALILAAQCEHRRERADRVSPRPFQTIDAHRDLVSEHAPKVELRTRRHTRGPAENPAPAAR